MPRLMNRKTIVKIASLFFGTTSLFILPFAIGITNTYAVGATSQSVQSRVYSLIHNQNYNSNEAIVVYKNGSGSVGSGSGKLSPKLLGPSVSNINSSIAIVKRPQNESYKNFLTGLEETANIKSVTPNYIRSFSSLPNNVDINNQKNLFMINAPVVSNSGFTSSLGGSSNIIVAVLDSGVAYTNYTNPLTGTVYGQAPSLASLNITDPYNALAVYNNQTVNEYQPYDSVGHGTYVTGVIASSTNNDSSGSTQYGTAGIAFNSTIMPVKIGNSQGVPVSAEIMGIQWAIDHHANVINLSIESMTPSSAEETEIEDAISAGISVVASSGNESSSSLAYPAGYPGVIAVGASNSQNLLTSYSNYGCSSLGNCQTLVAPVGYSTPLVYQETYTGYDTNNVTSYTSFSNEYLAGTSFSAPQAVAAIALYDSKYGVQNPQSINLLFKESSTRLGGGVNNTYGYGLLNINAMLQIQNSGEEYNILSKNGKVYTFGAGTFYGDLTTITGTIPNRTPVMAATTPDKKGYYILTQDGGIYTFGDAQFYGSVFNIPNAPVKTPVAIVPTPAGKGYYVLTTDGGVYTFGDAQFYGSLYNIPQSALPDRTPVSFALTPNGEGYYIVTSNGAVYTFGNAQFQGSVFNIPNAPVKTTVTFSLTPSGSGYYLITKDGAVYTFGDAQFYGSMYNIPNQPSDIPVGFVINSNNNGYYILTNNGAIYTFGNSQFYGSIYNTSIPQSLF